MPMKGAYGNCARTVWAEFNGMGGWSQRPTASARQARQGRPNLPARSSATLRVGGQRKKHEQDLDSAWLPWARRCLRISLPDAGDPASIHVEPPTISDDFSWCGRTRFGTGGNQNRLRQRRPAQGICAPFSANSAPQVGTAPRHDRAPLSATFPRQFLCAIFVPVEFLEAVWNPSPE